jgi:hypothetical protein
MEPAPDKRVAWDVQKRCFVLNRTTPLKGVTKVIQMHFFPDYREHLATRGRDVVPQARASSEQRARVRQIVGASGFELGTLVDREVTDWVRLIWRYGLDPIHYVAVGAETAWPAAPTHLPLADRARLVHLQHNGNLYTRRVLRELNDRRLVPMLSQYCVGSLDARLGTAVDIVAVRPEHVVRLPHGGGFQLRPGSPVVLIELKCGFEDTYHKHTGQNMRVPLAHLDDSYANQHQLQLLLTRILFERTYRHQGHSVSEAAVLRVHSAGVSWYPQRAWTDAEQIAVWQRVVRARELPSTTARKQRRTAKLRAAAASAGGVYAGPAVAPKRRAAGTTNSAKKKKKPRSH